MKLLFDQNLSRRLPQRLADLFPGSVHVIGLGFDRASDIEIWDFAQKNDYCIVTQDVDFSERSKLRGAPPKVVWLRCGNCKPDRVEAILRKNAVLLGELATDAALRYVEIF